MWELVSFVAAILVLVYLLELFDLPDWLRAHFKKKSKTQATLDKKVEILELKIQELERKVQQLSE